MTVVEHRIDTTDHPEIQTRLMSSLDEMEQIYHVRREVFVLEQGLTGTVYDDPDDRYSYHVLATVGDVLAGVGRMTMIGQEGQIAWLAVLREHRRSGVGRAIMAHLLQTAADDGAKHVTLNAQTHALAFYTAFGFQPIGRRFSMSRIEHQLMVLQLSETRSS